MRSAALVILIVCLAAPRGEARQHSTSDGKIYIASGLTASDVELLKKDCPAQK